MPLARQFTHLPLQCPAAAPFGNVYAISDGAAKRGGGIPYFYTTLMDSSMIDIFSGGHTNVSLTLSEATSSANYSECVAWAGGDPENPPCARLTLSGAFLNVSGTGEERAAREALFTRHPMMKSWPQEHGWFFAKIDVAGIWLIDFYGGASIINPADYFGANSSLAP